jgi:hypothetical protein
MKGYKKLKEVDLKKKDVEFFIRVVGDSGQRTIFDLPEDIVLGCQILSDACFRSSGDILVEVYFIYGLVRVSSYRNFLGREKFSKFLKEEYKEMKDYCFSYFKR